MSGKRSEIRVALVGAGRFGTRRAQAVAKSSQSSLVLVADHDSSTAKVASEKFQCRMTTDWREAVSARDIDAIIVSTPTGLSSEVALSAVQAGKHVLTEKPCAVSSAEFLAVVNEAKARDVIVKAGYNHRYHRALRCAHDYFKQGRIGRPVFARCVYGHGGRRGYESEWRGQGALSGGGELLDQGVHALDLFQWFLGEISEVCGMTSTAFWPIAPSEDNVFAILKTKENVLAQLHASWTNWKNTFSFEIFGDKGYIVAQGLGGSYGVEKLGLGLRNQPGDVPQEQWTEYPQPDDSLEREWEEFLGALLESREPASNGRDAFRTLQVVEAIRKSSRDGCSVRL